VKNIQLMQPGRRYPSTFEVGGESEWQGLRVVPDAVFSLGNPNCSANFSLRAENDLPENQVSLKDKNLDSIEPAVKIGIPSFIENGVSPGIE
jgi:hypothetical protein